MGLPPIPFRRQLGLRFGRRFNRRPSPVLAYVTPWLTVVLGSALPGWLTIASAPLLPPLGFLTLLGWRQLRPGLLPVWAGLPLGLVDDLVSGQPVGCAVLLWSLAMLALDAIEARFPWRNFAIEWLLAAAVIAAYLALSALIADSAANALSYGAALLLIAPQYALSVLLYPLITRAVAGFDRLRLLPFLAFD